MHVQVSPSDTIPVASLDSMPEATRKRMLTTDDTWFRTVSKVEEPEARQKAIDLGAYRSSEKYWAASTCLLGKERSFAGAVGPGLMFAAAQNLVLIR